MMKYTKKDVSSMFYRLIKVLNKDNWQLDYISDYGGYVIEEVLSGGGVSHPFGCLRRSTKEMYLSLYMTVTLAENLKYESEYLTLKSLI